MILDNYTQFCSAQAFTQAAPSTGVIDLLDVATGMPSKKEIDRGEPMAAIIQVTTAGAHATNPVGGYRVYWVMDDAATLDTPATVLGDGAVFLPPEAAVGTRRLLLLPVNLMVAKRYLGLYVNVDQPYGDDGNGGSVAAVWANISLSAYLAPLSAISSGFFTGAAE